MEMYMNEKTEAKKVFTLEDFKRWGSKGGKATLRKYGKKQAREWGKLGGIKGKKENDLTR